jgi:hypothetical protein
VLRSVAAANCRCGRPWPRAGCFQRQHPLPRPVVNRESDFGETPIPVKPGFLPRENFLKRECDKPPRRRDAEKYREFSRF